jgi:hypothetical protein
VDWDISLTRQKFLALSLLGLIDPRHCSSTTWNTPCHMPQGSSLPSRHVQNITRQYWIDPVNGSDSVTEADARDNINNPWQTLQKAADTIVNPTTGDVAINLLDTGVYQPTDNAQQICQIDSSPGPDSTHYWIIRKAPTAETKPVLKISAGTATNVHRHGFRIKVGYLIFEDFELTAPGNVTLTPSGSSAGFWIGDASGTQAPNCELFGIDIHGFTLADNTTRYQGVKPEWTGGGTCIIENCRIYDIGINGSDNLNHAAYVSDSDVWFINCVIWNMPKGYGLQMFAGTPTPYNIVHCTIDSTTMFKGPMNYDAGDDMQIRNSVFWNAASGIYMVHTNGGTGTNSNLDHLILRRASGSQFVEQPSDWTQTNVDTGSANPGFVDSVNHDYRPTEVSDMRGFSTTEWSRPYDIVGNPRPAGQEDAGAYQFVEQTLGSSLYPLLPESTGAIKYVATTGNDTTGDGSEANPWASFQKLLDTLTPGQQGVIAGGIYESPTLARHTLDSRHGTAFAPIEIRAAEGETVQIRPKASGGTDAFLITGASSYWKFKNLIFEEAVGDGTHNYTNMWCSSTGGGVHHVEFWNCEFREANEGSGTFVSESCHHIYYINCTSHDNHPTPLQNQSQGFYVTGDDCMLLNCIAYNQDGYGFQYRTNEAFGAQRIIVANCVAYNCKAITIPGNEHAGFVAESDVDGAQYWNNIAYDCKNGFRGLDASVVPSPVNICRKNIVYLSATASYRNLSLTNFVWDFDGAGDHGPSGNQNTAVGDNLYQDPLLVNPASADFHLQDDSPAIGYGNVDYCPPFDHNNNTRSQCDAGAFMYISGSGTIIPIRSRRAVQR